MSNQKDTMLAYLDTLCQALSAHDESAIRRLLRHPLAITLPRPVRAEAVALARAGAASRLAPTRTFRFYYQTQQLLASPDPALPPPEHALFDFAHYHQPAGAATAVHA